MMQYTDRHYRYLARQLSRHARLYTEMVVATALLRGDAQRFLAHDSAEHPVALQLGGSVPAELARAAIMGEDAGYCEINLNVGCPSERVQSGRFGACLIAEPTLVGECVAAMRNAVAVPITVKTRLGVDDYDSQEHLLGLVEVIVSAGCNALILHARKALSHFSPRANREIPALDYARVYGVKQAFPLLPVVINGGIKNLTEARAHLTNVDGVMLGRVACAQLELINEVDAELFGETPKPCDVAGTLSQVREYLLRESAAGTEIKHISRHWLGFLQGQPGAREWRRLLGTHSVRRDLDANDALNEALGWLRARSRSDAHWGSLHSPQPTRHAP